MSKKINELTSKQLEAINLLVYDNLTQDEIADKVGCNRTTLWSWRTKDEKFKEELTKERRNKLFNLGDVAIKQLEKLVKDDSDKRTQFQAIKAVLGEFNVLNDTKQVDVKTTIDFIISNNEQEN